MDWSQGHPHAQQGSTMSLCPQSSFYFLNFQSLSKLPRQSLNSPYGPVRSWICDPSASECYSWVASISGLHKAIKVHWGGKPSTQTINNELRSKQCAVWGWHSRWRRVQGEEARPVEMSKEIILGSMDTYRQPPESHQWAGCLTPPPHREFFVPWTELAIRKYWSFWESWPHFTFKTKTQNTWSDTWSNNRKEYFNWDCPRKI